MNWYDKKIKSYPAYSATKLVSDLDVLYPPFAVHIVKIFAIARKEGLPVCIYETYRSQERQLELFNKGVTKLKTNGMHHFGVATDIVFLDDKNNPSWGEKYNWKRLGEIGKSMGLIWGGDWPWDKPHFQLIPATAVDQAKISKGEYPFYDSSVDGQVEELLKLYAEVRQADFSDAAITKLISFFSNSGSREKISETPPVPSIIKISKKLFDRDLNKGCSGPDVKILQKCLNKDSDTQIAFNGLGSSGQETELFGDLAERAVQKFQTKHGIAIVGDAGYGIVGPRTREKLQELFGGVVS